MSLARLLSTRAVEVLTADVVAGYGDGTTEDWSDPAVRATTGWLALRNPSTVRPDGTRDAEVSDWILLLASGDPITGRNRVRCGGRVFTVEGTPNEAFTQRGEHHVEVALREVVG